MNLPHGGQKAFTLIELLTVIAITALLASLLLPVISRTREQAENIECVSNLRQIGAASLRYATDHDHCLPGPLMQSQYGYWDHYTQMAWYLEDYLDVEKRRGKTRRDVFTCRANRRESVDPANTPIFMINVNVEMEGRTGPQVPFGYPNEYSSRLRGIPFDEPPMRVSDLADIVGNNGVTALATTWALKDMDATDNALIDNTSSYKRRLPQRMVHGGHRNALFFDFHVARIDPDDKPL